LIDYPNSFFGSFHLHGWFFGVLISGAANAFIFIFCTQAGPSGAQLVDRKKPDMQFAAIQESYQPINRGAPIKKKVKSKKLRASSLCPDRLF
jgi:hypothetical protein